MTTNIIYREKYYHGVQAYFGHNLGTLQKGKSKPIFLKNPKTKTKILIVYLFENGNIFELVEYKNICFNLWAV